MIGQMTEQMRPHPKNPPVDAWEKRDACMRKADILHTIDGLYAISRRGLWRLILFLAISAIALHFRNFDLFAVLPENICELLGAPPPPILIHCLLTVSSCSALILIAGRGSEASSGCNGWVQFGLSVAFYALYAAANVLNEFFPAVFVAGMLILIFDHISVWVETSRAIREERERLGKLA
jgi:hypothetical protein